MMECMYVCVSVTFLLILPSPIVFTPDDPPRPSRPKAGLGLVMMMMRSVYSFVSSLSRCDHCLLMHLQCPMQSNSNRVLASLFSSAYII